MTGVLWTSGVGMYLQGGKSMFMCTYIKFFIMSTEFDKNISDWKYDCTDHKKMDLIFSRNLLNGQK